MSSSYMTADVYHMLQNENFTNVKSSKYLNQFDRINGKDAKEMLRPTRETEEILNDPRMSQWMKLNGMDTSPALMEQMIYNNTVPNVRKITQSDPTTTNGTMIRMKKYVGNDIDWREKNGVEREVFVKPEETRLNLPVASSGKGTLNDNVSSSRTFYQDNASKYMNNYQEVDRIHVGRGINADSGSFMNLNYSMDAKVLLRDYNPGVQKQVILYDENQNNLDMGSLKKFGNIDERGEYLHKKTIEQPVETKQLEKFTSELLQNSVAPRTLKSLLDERNSTEYERNPSDTFEYDQSTLNTPVPKLIQGLPRDQMVTQTKPFKTIESVNEHAQKGMSLKQMISRMDSEYISHPHRGVNTSLQNETVLSKKSNDLTRNTPENTLWSRKLSSDANAFVPLKSHGGGQPKTSSASSSTLTQDTRNVVFTIEPTREKNYGHSEEKRKDTIYNTKKHETMETNLSNHGKKITGSIQPNEYNDTNERSQRNRPVVSLENEGVRTKHAFIQSGSEITSNKFARNQDTIDMTIEHKRNIKKMTANPSQNLPGSNTRAPKKTNVFNIQLI